MSSVAAARQKLFSQEAVEEKEKLYAEDLYNRRVQAIRWVDKEIRKLIAVILKEGKNSTIYFGHLYDITQNTFEAISGTLVAAKKRGVVEYDGMLLLSGPHNDVVITLKRTEIEDSPIPDKEQYLNQMIQPTEKPGGFDRIEHKDNKCAECGKTVYNNERLTALGKLFHNKCFVCVVCKCVLKLSAFCCVNNKVYCRKDYEDHFRKYGFNDPEAQRKPTPAAPATPSSTATASAPASTSTPSSAAADKIKEAELALAREKEKAAAEKAAAEKAAAQKAAAEKAAAEKAAAEKAAAERAAAEKAAAEKAAAERAAAERAAAERAAAEKAAAERAAAERAAAERAAAERAAAERAAAERAAAERAAAEKAAAEKAAAEKAAAEKAAAERAAAERAAAERAAAERAAAEKAAAERAAAEKAAAERAAAEKAAAERAAAEKIAAAKVSATPETQTPHDVAVGNVRAAANFWKQLEQQKQAPATSATDAKSAPKPFSETTKSTSPTPVAVATTTPKAPATPSSPTPATKPVVPPAPSTSAAGLAPKGAAPPPPPPPPARKPPTVIVSPTASNATTTTVTSVTTTTMTTVVSPTSKASQPAPVSPTSPASPSSPAASRPAQHRGAVLASHQAAASAAADAMAQTGRPWGASVITEGNRDRSRTEAPPVLFSRTAFNIETLGRNYRILATLIEYLAMNGLYEMDIFRVNYDPAETARLVSACEQCTDLNQLKNSLSQYSISSIASALKKLLHNREPLIPSRLYSTFLALHSSFKAKPDSDSIGKYLNIAAMISEMPENNKKLMCLLFDLLALVKYHELYTRMSPEKLAYTFAPILLKPAKLPTSVDVVMSEQLQSNSLILDLINNHESVWENVSFESKFTEADEVKMVDKSDVTECSQCSKQFGVFNWKVHCLGCGQVFCSSCCSHKAPESLVGRKGGALAGLLSKENVCNNCHLRLSSDAV